MPAGNKTWTLLNPTPQSEFTHIRPVLATVTTLAVRIDSSYRTKTQ